MCLNIHNLKYSYTKLMLVDVSTKAHFMLQKCFTINSLYNLRVVKQWTRLPKEVVEAPSLETLKARLDGALSNLV